MRLPVVVLTTLYEPFSTISFYRFAL
jgi:hypothetical protein